MVSGRAFHPRARIILRFSRSSARRFGKPPHMNRENGRCCPYLGERKGSGHHVDYPSSRNVCLAKYTYKNKLLRLEVVPYSAVPVKQQREQCLWAYLKCPIYQLEEAKLAKS